MLCDQNFIKKNIYFQLSDIKLLILNDNIRCKSQRSFVAMSKFMENF